MTDNLKLFVVYSSIVVAIGNIGQSVYGSANAYLDGIIQERVQNGLTGCSIRWPAISSIGMAAATASHTENTLFSRCIPPESVEAVLGRIFSLCSSSMSMTQASSLVDPVKTIFPTSYIGVLSSDSNPQLMNVLTSLKEKRTNLQPKRGYMKAFKFRSNDEIKVWTETETKEAA